MTEAVSRLARQKRPSSNIRTISCPRNLQFFLWLLDPINFLKRGRRKCGDYLAVYFHADSQRPMILVSDPEAVEYMLAHDNDRELSAPGEVNTLFEPLLGSRGMVLLSGEAHRNRRKLVMPSFHGTSLLQYGQIAQEATVQALSKLPPNKPFDVQPIANQISMEVLLKVAFGRDLSSQQKRIGQLITERLSKGLSPFEMLLNFIPIVSHLSRKHVEEIANENEELLYAEIRDRRAAEGSDSRCDLLSLLCSARYEDEEELRYVAIRDELMTAFSGANETTSAALAWALYWIHARPAVKKNLLAELETVTDFEDPVQVTRLPYLSAVCNETLRICPPTPLTLPRRVESPIELGNYAFERGDLLVADVVTIHSREDIYPQPEQFRPERFLERKFSSGEYLPFGGGARRCVGAALVAFELKLVISTVLRQFELKLEDRHPPVQPKRQNLTLGPDRPIRLRIIG